MLRGKQEHDVSSQESTNTKISECLAINLWPLQRIRKELGESNGDYEVAATLKPHSDCSTKRTPRIGWLVSDNLFILRPTTGQVQHKAFFKVGPDAWPQPTSVRQNPKIPSAPSALPKWVPMRPGNKKQIIGKTIQTMIVIYPNKSMRSIGGSTNSNIHMFTYIYAYIYKHFVTLISHCNSPSD